eukprot:3226043-Amphidinium_carterae.1
MYSFTIFKHLLGTFLKFGGSGGSVPSGACRNPTTLCLEEYLEIPCLGSSMRFVMTYEVVIALGGEAL